MNFRSVITALLLLLPFWCGAQPICQITHYDEFSGLSQQSVKQVAQDGQGMIWMATWNGLNRFDGYHFNVVKPHVGDGIGIYSDRINGIVKNAKGNLWCRIDQRCYLFNVKTYYFTDFLTPIEQRLKTTLKIIRMRTAQDGTTVFECEGGSFLVVEDGNPVETAQLVSQMPRKKYRLLGNKQYRQFVGFSEESFVFSGTDRFGVIWMITPDGDIYYTRDVKAAMTRYPERIPDGNLMFSLVDTQGNVWLRGNDGVSKLSFSRYPYEQLALQPASPGRAFMRDSKGRIWVACREDATVRIYSSQMKLQGYLSPSGKVQPGYVSFGARVYCMLEDRNHQIWLGTKPEGLFRLREQGEGGFTLKHFLYDQQNAWSLAADNIYDLQQDAQGRLWIATMKGGLCCVEQPMDDDPRFSRLKNFPEECMSLRRILITRQGVMLMASTGGLVVSDSREPINRMSFHRHVGEANRASSLSNVAVMDVVEDRQGKVFVATESGGVNQILNSNLLDDQLQFRHFDESHGLPSDVAISLVSYGDAIWVVSSHSLIRLDPTTGVAANYDANYWERELRFTEAHPLQLQDGRWLIGMQDGVIMTSLDKMERPVVVPRIALTSIMVQNGRDSLAVNDLDTLILRPHERNLTVNFAALDYVDASNIQYAFRLEGDENQWNFIGRNHSATFLDMEPGTYHLQIRSTNSNGEWMDNIRTLTIIVKPTFWETPWAKLLWILLIAGVVYAIVRTFLYIKAIKRKQHDTLEAYLRLMEERENERTIYEKTGERGSEGTRNVSTPEDSSKGNLSPTSPRPLVPSLSEADEAFMRRVMDFMEKHLSDSEVNIQDMADATATSKTNLNRKMKSLLGVTPADFLRQSRIQRACQLLCETEMSISEIALTCGFADQNYFSKAFRSQKGVSPSSFRAKGING